MDNFRQYAKHTSFMSMPLHRPIIIDDPYRDIYVWKACKLFGVFEIDVTPAMRKFAKRYYYKQMYTLYNYACNKNIKRLLYGECYAQEKEEETIHLDS